MKSWQEIDFYILIYRLLNVLLTPGDGTPQKSTNLWFRSTILLVNLRLYCSILIMRLFIFFIEMLFYLYNRRDLMLENFPFLFYILDVLPVWLFDTNCYQVLTVQFCTDTQRKLTNQWPLQCTVGLASLCWPTLAITRPM